MVTLGLIAGCGVVFYYTAGGLTQLHIGIDPAIAAQYAFDAHRLISTDLLREPAQVLATVVTSVFLHANLVHIVTNMLFLWIFGDNVEDRLGKIKFPVFYVLCGIAGNLAQAIFSGFRVTMLGASGAVAGVLAAYFVSFRGARVMTFIFPWSLFAGLIPIPARFFIVLWIIMQVFAGAGALAGQPSNVAWFAHIGGFLAGWVLCKWMCPKPRLPRRGPTLAWLRER